jgi:hypothetical protein
MDAQRIQNLLAGFAGEFEIKSVTPDDHTSSLIAAAGDGSKNSWLRLPACSDKEKFVLHGASAELFSRAVQMKGRVL